MAHRSQGRISRKEAPKSRLTVAISASLSVCGGLTAYLRDANVPAAGEQITMHDFFLSPDSTHAAGTHFGSWVAEHIAALQQTACKIPDSRCKIDIDKALCRSSQMLEQVFSEFSERLAGYEQQKTQLTAAMANVAPGDLVRLASAVASVERLSGQLCEERLIDYLASSHWLPSYAFPQDVMKLLVRRPERANKYRLERDAEYAISEYSPGAEVIVDGKLVRSGGVDLRNREMEILIYKVCPRCNQVRVWHTESEIIAACPSCGEISSQIRKFIQPKGFTTLFDEPIEEVRLNQLKPPSTSEVFLIEGADATAFIQHHAAKGVSLGYRRDGELFRANSGVKGKQFKICRKCGRGFDSRQNNHKTPWGLICKGGSIISVDLVCRFRTDTLQLRFDTMNPAPPSMDNRAFWHSFQTAFVGAAADVLSVPPRDLGGTFRGQSEGSLKGELVIYDRVPGGAGYVKRIVDDLVPILEEVFCRTSKCKNPLCDPEGSCYSCLRSYQNQFNWESLNGIWYLSG